MALFPFSIGRDLADRKFAQLHALLRASFGNVKRDTHLVFQWLDYLNRRTVSQEEVIAKLQKDLSLVPRPEDIRRAVDQAFHDQDLLKRLGSLEEKLSRQLMPVPQPVQKAPGSQEVSVHHGLSPKDSLDVHERLERLEKRRANIKERLIKRITRNSKEYARSVILSLIRKYEQMPAQQLREMIVEEQGLCSKSSFYRLLEEIEQMDDIMVIKKGKEKHFRAVARKVHSG